MSNAKYLAYAATDAHFSCKLIRSLRRKNKNSNSTTEIRNVIRQRLHAYITTYLSCIRFRAQVEFILKVNLTILHMKFVPVLSDQNCMEMRKSHVCFFFCGC